jgi:hypothetical protein
MTHDEAANAANVRLVIDSYDKQVRQLHQRLRHAEHEVRTLRRIVSVFENYHEERKSA